MSSSKANRINIKNIHFALLTQDDSDGVAYDTPIALPYAMQAQVTPSQATGVLYGDGAQQENIGRLTGIALQLDINKIPIEYRAAMLGHTFENGVMIEKDGDEAPYLALGYEVEQTNGYSEFLWFLKGRVQEGNQTVQQQTKDVNFSTDQITINFIKRDYDGCFRYYADTANSEFDETQAEAWFDEGPASYPVASSDE